MEDFDHRGHSVLTPEGQIQSNRAFVRGLKSRYGNTRVERVIGRLALAGAIGFFALAIFT